MDPSDEGTATSGSSLFVYGSLLAAPFVQRLLGWRPDGVAARLDGYARYAVRGQSYPGIVQQPGCSVTGLVYCGLSARDWLRLDDYEGEQYLRRLVSVQFLEASSAVSGPVLAYVIRDEYRFVLSQSPWIEPR